MANKCLRFGAEGVVSMGNDVSPYFVRSLALIKKS